MLSKFSYSQPNFLKDVFMKVILDSLFEGAARARGTVIIIDVFRAFTTAAVAFSRGASHIYLVSEVEEALDLRRRGIAQLCMGEVGGVKPDGFNFGNSPFEILTAEVAGKVICQSTRAGTVGVVSATQADSLFVSSLVIASATAKAVREQNPELVTIVAMGVGGCDRTDEDEQCALYLRNLLQGRQPSSCSVRNLILSGESSLQFEDIRQQQFHPMDREIALNINSYDFAIKVSTQGKFLVAEPVYL